MSLKNSTYSGGLKRSFLRGLGLGLLAGWVSLHASPDPFVTSAPMIRVWPGVAPGSEGKVSAEQWVEGGMPDAFHRVTNIHEPSLTLYLAPEDRTTGTAVIIAPGGGHRYLVVDLEGEAVAKKLNEQGISAFVLRSRLARAEGSTYRAEVESLADLQQAIRVVLAHAKEWKVDPARLGLMGFSAGGHLVALALGSTEVSTRPAFAVLAYPGWRTPPAIAEHAPPVFMFVNDDDPLATGAGEYYLALRRAKVPTEFHVFPRGGHGVGATGRGPGFEKLAVSRWPELFTRWLDERQLLH